MKPLTAYLAKLFGLYMLLVGIVMFLEKDTMPATATALAHDPGLLLLFALVTLAAGLAIVLAHNIWTGGAPTVIVTLIGWVMLLKGLALMYLSSEGADTLMTQMHYQDLFYIYAALPTLLGLYLTWVSFRKVKGRK